MPRIFLVLSLLGMLLIPVSGIMADTLVVNQISGPYYSIGAALGDANPGDTIEVTDAGSVHYDETLEIDLAVTLTFTGTGTANLSNQSIADTPTILVQATGNLTLRNFNMLDGVDSAIEVDGGAATVYRCNIAGNDGNSPALGGDENSDASVYNNGSLFFELCSFDQSSRENEGVILISNGAGCILTVLDCEIRSAGSPSNKGGFDLYDSAIVVVSGNVSIEQSRLWVGGTYGVVTVGFDDPHCVLMINRTIIQQNPDAYQPAKYIVSGSPLGLSGGYTSQIRLAHTVIDGGNTVGLGNTEGACIYAQNGTTLLANHCTIIRGGQYGIWMIGDGPDVTLANSLIGEQGVEGTHWDQQGSYSATLTQDYCHYYASPSGHYSSGGSGLTLTSTNITLDIPPMLNSLYEIGSPSGEFTDSGRSALIENPALVTDDLDEVGIRPRGEYNDKGAQEGQYVAPSPTPIPASVRDWNSLR